MLAVDGQKQCYRCKETKAVAEFHRNRCARDGLQAACKACQDIQRGVKRKMRPPKDGTRHCYRCGIYKPVGEFYGRLEKPAGGSDGRCKSCIADIQKSYRARNPEKAKEWDRRSRAKRAPQSRLYHLMWKYGLTKEQVDAMLAAQGGACAICGGQPKGGAAQGTYHVDHCHATGRVRGLLCGFCNSGLGYFVDSPPILRAAAAYLEKTATRPSRLQTREPVASEARAST